MSMTQLIVRYFAFAVLAILVNLASQRMVLAIVPGHLGFALAVIAGTSTSLVVKYVLDKRWIFEDQSTGIGNHGKKFGLYTVMGIITTLIFWGVETAFWLTWHTELMREVGAVMGLCIGYLIKYNLDRRFVFRSIAQA